MSRPLLYTCSQFGGAWAVALFAPISPLVLGESSDCVVICSACLFWLPLAFEVAGRVSTTYKEMPTITITAGEAPGTGTVPATSSPSKYQLGALVLTVAVPPLPAYAVQVDTDESVDSGPDGPSPLTSVV